MLHEFRSYESLFVLQSLTRQCFCSGTGYLARRASIDQIGGYPELSIQEDFLTSIFLWAAGWQTVLVPGFLQWGCTAGSFPGYLRTRQRWAAGFISLAQCLSSPSAHNVDPAARLNVVLFSIIDSSTALMWTACMFFSHRSQCSKRHSYSPKVIGVFLVWRRWTSCAKAYIKPPSLH